MAKTAASHVIFMLGAVIALGCTAAVGQTGHKIVFCLDEKLDTVAKTLASDCKGTIVSKTEAEAVRERRKSYIRDVLARPAGSPLQGKNLASLGSGFFVSDDGTVLTSEHVVAGCSAVSVTPTFGDMAIATAVVPDRTADLALLQTAAQPPRIASFAGGSGPLAIGSAFIVGYPEHGMPTVTPILTPVEVLSRESQTPRGPAIIVRGDVRRGNSGGVLLDAGGNVIGVVAAKVDTVSVYQATGTVARNIGLVLPNDRVQSFLQSHGVAFAEGQRRSILDADRMLLEARPFMVQVGCWK